MAFVVIALLLSVASAAVPFNNDIEQGESLTSISSCAEHGGITGILNCAALRSLKTLHRLARQPSFEILPGITLQREIKEDELPTNPQLRAEKLYEMLIDDGAKVISGRTLHMKLPEDVIENVARALEEGRKRKKGGIMPFMFRMGAKLMGLVPAALAGLGLLATKALIVAKIALMLSLFVFIGSFNKQNNGGLLGGLGGFGGLGGGGYSYGTGYGSYNPSTWTSNSIGGSPQLPYARSLPVGEELTHAKHESSK